MKNFKKSLLLFTAFLMVISPLAAVSMTVTWEWLLDDADVTAYRYQVGGEDEDGWTVIDDADTDELTLSNLDPYSDYTLYLQRSYDGVNWSESASSTAEAIIVEIPEGIETASAFAAYLAGEDVALEVAAEEEAAVEEAAVEEAVAEEAVIEEVVEEEAAVEAAVITETLYGYTLTVTVNEDNVVLGYPQVVTQEDAAGFFAYEVDKYGAAYLSGVYYTIGDGTSTLTLPAGVTAEDAEGYVPVLVDDIVEYVNVLLAPAAEEAAAEEEAVAEEAVVEEVVEEEAAVEEETVVAEAPVIVATSKKKVTDNYEFSILANIGVGFTNLSFENTYAHLMPAKFALGFEFKDIVSNDALGFGLRLNLGTDFIPKDGWDDSSLDAADYFDVTNYDSMFNADIMAFVNFGGSTNLLNFYLGGGAGIALSPNAGDEDSDIAALLDLDTYEVDSHTSLSYDWYATALAGIRFEIGNVFSLGLEGTYRYYVSSEEHYLSADVVFGFTF